MQKPNFYDLKPNKRINPANSPGETSGSPKRGKVPAVHLQFHRGHVVDRESSRDWGEGSTGALVGSTGNWGSVERLGTKQKWSTVLRYAMLCCAMLWSAGSNSPGACGCPHTLRAWLRWMLRPDSSSAAEENNSWWQLIRTSHPDSLGCWRPEPSEIWWQDGPVQSEFL